MINEPRVQLSDQRGVLGIAVNRLVANLLVGCRHYWDKVNPSSLVDVKLVHSWCFIVEGQQPQIQSTESRFIERYFDVGSQASSPMLGLWKWSSVVDTRQRIRRTCANAKSPKRGFGPNRPDRDSGESSRRTVATASRQRRDTIRQRRVWRVSGRDRRCRGKTGKYGRNVECDGRNWVDHWCYRCTSPGLRWFLRYSDCLVVGGFSAVSREMWASGSDCQSADR
jgi:hypothetical protein